MTTSPSDVVVEHFVSREDIYELQAIFGHQPWIDLLWQTRKDRDDLLLSGGTY
jgi:hypothetical protein